MNSKLIPLTIAAVLAITGVSANAATGSTKAKAATPLKIGVTDSDGITRYKGKTIVSGTLEYNMINEAMCQTCFTVDSKSKAMIPKKPKTDYPTEFAIVSDSPQITALKLNANKCYLIPMTVEIDGYYASNDGSGGFDGANLIKIIKKGVPALTSCHMGSD